MPSTVSSNVLSKCLIAPSLVLSASKRVYLTLWTDQQAALGMEIVKDLHSVVTLSSPTRRHDENKAVFLGLHPNGSRVGTLERAIP